MGELPAYQMRRRILVRPCPPHKSSNASSQYLGPYHWLASSRRYCPTQIEYLWVGGGIDDDVAFGELAKNRRRRVRCLLASKFYAPHFRRNAWVDGLQPCAEGVNLVGANILQGVVLAHQG